MKTQNVNTKLTFSKNSVLELNDTHLLYVNGGSSKTILAPIISISIIVSVITIVGINE